MRTVNETPMLSYGYYAKLWVGLSNGLTRSSVSFETPDDTSSCREPSLGI